MISCSLAHLDSLNLTYVCVDRGSETEGGGRERLRGYSVTLDLVRWVVQHISLSRGPTNVPGLGKILQDTNTLSSYEIKPNDQIVCMVQKVRSASIKISLPPFVLGYKHEYLKHWGVLLQIYIATLARQPVLHRLTRI